MYFPSSGFDVESQYNTCLSRLLGLSVKILRGWKGFGIIFLFPIFSVTITYQALGKEGEKAVTEQHLHTPNRLISEKSPYLLQHAYNPVDWYPWGEEAFERARREDRPIFLSIGYSTCHWCHVMERESFEDEGVASLLNRAFVCIKVDREERPDIDQIYMTICQIMTGSGGWPLTIIMTPDKRPFFAATYLPRTSRFGRIGLMELIPRIEELWKHKRSEVLGSTDKIIRALGTVEKAPAPSSLTVKTLGAAFEALKQRYDEEYGGFGTSPKFPSPHQLFFLLRYWHRTGATKALEMVEKTLLHMTMGGIHDHIGYGFHRYSTDRQWLLPHFEKMLYDQALMTMAYLEAFQATAKKDYATTARQVFEYVIRDMTSPLGGFYCAEDADSEGAEGKFYVWRRDEILKVLGGDLGGLFCKIYNIKEEGNYKEESTGSPNGTNILYLSKPLDLLAAEMGMAHSTLATRLREAREILFSEREKRVRPERDDKILTDWNGLMIAAFAMGARTLNDPEYLDAGRRAADFVLRYLRARQGRLLHRYRDGEAAIDAHLDDYAFFIWGLIELYEASFDPLYLKEAVDLTNIMLRHYWDPIKGGLFFTPDDGEDLIIRKKELYDGAMPSGNSVALMDLLRLAHLTGKADLEQKASELVKAFSGQVAQAPLAYTQFLCGLDFALGPTREVLLIGQEGADDTKRMIHTAFSGFHPTVVVLFKPSGRGKAGIDSLAPFAASNQAVQGRATAYLCEGFACHRPTTDPDELARLLAGSEK